jgi:hypothetical protein
MSAIEVFLIDDQIPKIPEFIEADLYRDGIVNQDTLTRLAAEDHWTGEHGLWELTNNLVNHPYAKDGSISITGFLNPGFYLNRSGEFQKPNVAVFDWEYQITLDNSAEAMLLEFLDVTQAFVFVYSSFKAHIPPSLVKPSFDKFANRFQLFEKGNKTNSVLSSEDFIFQYVLTLVNKDNTIKIQNTDVTFESSGYLKTPSDIRYLESILGREALLKSIDDLGNKFSTDTVEKMIENTHGVLRIDDRRRFLVAFDATVYIERFKATNEISFVDALKEFGIAKLQEVLEIGLTRV